MEEMRAKGVRRNAIDLHRSNEKDATEKQYTMVTAPFDVVAAVGPSLFAEHWGIFVEEPVTVTMRGGGVAARKRLAAAWLGGR